MVRTWELQFLFDTMTFPSAVRLEAQAGFAKCSEDDRERLSTPDMNGSLRNLFFEIRCSHEMAESKSACNVMKITKRDLIDQYILRKINKECRSELLVNKICLQQFFWLVCQ